MKTCHEFTCICSPFLGPFFLPHVFNPWNGKGEKSCLESLEPALKQQPRQLFCGNWLVILGAEEPEPVLAPEPTIPWPSQSPSRPCTYHPVTPPPFIICLVVIFAWGWIQIDGSSIYGKSCRADLHPELSSPEPSAEALNPAPQTSWPNSSWFARDFPSISTESPTSLNPSVVSKPAWLVTYMDQLLCRDCHPLNSCLLSPRNIFKVLFFKISLSLVSPKGVGITRPRGKSTFLSIIKAEWVTFL